MLCNIIHMFEVRYSDVFESWLDDLADVNAKQRVLVRLRRLELGNAGDAKSVGDGVSELRIDYGPGYRIYFTRRGRVIVIMLCGGSKKSQIADIAKAKEMAKEF